MGRDCDILARVGKHWLIGDTKTMKKQVVDNAGEKSEKKRKGGRSKGSGWLVKRGRNWCACWKHNGKLYKRTTGTGDKEKAEKKLDEFTKIYQLKDERQSYAALAAKVETVENKLKAEFDKKSALSLSEAWTIYQPILLQRVKASTAAVDNSHFNIFCKWIAENYPGVKEVREITRRIAREFYESVEKKTTPRSAGRYVSTFALWWGALIERDEAAREDGNGDIDLLENFKPARIAANPWVAIKVKNDSPKFSRRELTVEELNRVYNATDGEMRLLFGVGIYTGLRLGDCALLDWGKIDMVRGFLSLSPHKTESSSGVKIREAIPLPLNDMLQEIPEEKRTGFVMPEIAEMYKSSPARLCHRIQDIFHKCGIETTVEVLDGKRKRTLVGFHSLRHTYVSLVLNRGGSMSVVQKTVGHTTAAMTGHYLHLDETALKATAALLPDIRSEDIEPVKKSAVDFSVVYKQIDLMDMVGLEQVKSYVEKKMTVLKLGGMK